MKLDYKKELEGAAKTMILIHDPGTLIKMIVRNVVRKVKLTHAGMLLYHKDKDTYILTISRGKTGVKIQNSKLTMSNNPQTKNYRLIYCFYDY